MVPFLSSWRRNHLFLGGDITLCPSHRRKIGKDFLPVSLTIVRKHFELWNLFPPEKETNTRKTFYLQINHDWHMADSNGKKKAILPVKVFYTYWISRLEMYSWHHTNEWFIHVKKLTFKLLYELSIECKLLLQKHFFVPLSDIDAKGQQNAYQPLNRYFYINSRVSYRQQ